MGVMMWEDMWTMMWEDMWTMMWEDMWAMMWAMMLEDMEERTWQLYACVRDG